MADESYSFSTARTRLEAIVTQVRKKDTSLEKSLDLLEEGVRLANACTELIDHADWVAAGALRGEAAVVETRAQSSDSRSPTSRVEARGLPPMSPSPTESRADAGPRGDCGLRATMLTRVDEAWADDEPPADDDSAADDDPVGRRAVTLRLR